METGSEITTAEAAYGILRGMMRTDVEEVWALALGPSKLVLRCEMIFRGTADACLIHPRDIFRFACLHNASALIVAHNHPSGDSRPSEQDLLMTRQLIRAAGILEIPVLDHLIVTHRGYTSLANQGWSGFSGTSPVARGRHRKENGRQLSMG